MMKKKYKEQHEDGSYVVKKSRRSNILAFIACVLIAFCIWAVAEGAKARNSTQDDDQPSGEQQTAGVDTGAATDVA